MDAIINDHRLITAMLILSTLFSCCSTSIIDPSLIHGGRTFQGGDDMAGQATGGHHGQKKDGATNGFWKDWARDKIVEGLGHRHENSRIAAQQMKDAAGEITMKAKEKVSDAASEVLNHAAEEAKDVLKMKAEDAKQATKNNGQETATEKLARAGREMRAKLKKKVAEL